MDVDMMGTWSPADLIPPWRALLRSLCLMGCLLCPHVTSWADDDLLPERVCEPDRCAGEDSVWLISTRHLGCAQPGHFTSEDLRVWQSQVGGRWRRSTVSELTSQVDADQDPNSVTTLYVDGNRVDAADAIRRGMRIYCELRQRTPAHRRFCHVIWSWPSDKVAAPVKDTRIKASRTISEGYYLGSFLAEMPSTKRISLIGYSFGPRIITKSLHLMGGGAADGMALPQEKLVASPPRYRVVAFAAALDNDWLVPGRRHGQAISVIDRMLLIYNSRDAALKRYGRIYGRPGVEALGYTGLVHAVCLGDAASRIDQMDATCVVGKQHNWDLYVADQNLMDSMSRYAVWESETVAELDETRDQQARITSHQAR